MKGRQLRFAVRRPRQPPTSPRSVSRRDVPCSVQIGVGRVPAGPAPEDGLALTRLPVYGPALRATPARERGGHVFQPSCCLVLHPGGEHAPPGGEDRPVQPCLLPHVAAWPLDRALGGAGHVPYVQVLAADQVVVPCDLGGPLLHPVPAGVGVARVRPSQPRLELGATDGAAPGPVQPALQPLDAAGGRGLVAAAVRQHQRHRHPRSIPTTSPVPGPGIDGGAAQKATCQRPARSRVTR